MAVKLQPMSDRLVVKPMQSEEKTKSGIPVHCFVTRISPQTNENLDQFERELNEQKAPTPEIMAYPLRMIL